MLDLSYAPMGRTMIGGLVTSNLVTLAAVPPLYSPLEELRLYGARIANNFFRRADKDSRQERLDR